MNSENKIKVTLGIPTNRGLRPKMAESIFNLVARGGYDFHIILATEGYTTSENRNYITVKALNNGSDYLLFSDDDMTFPPDTLDRLLEHQKEIIGVLSYSRKLPLQPTVQLLDGSVLKYGEAPDKLFEVKAVGGGVLLIKMKVFTKIEQPFFNIKSHPSGFTLVGEDSWFCEKARDAGFKVYCEPSLSVGHLGEYNYSK